LSIQFEHGEIAMSSLKGKVAIVTGASRGIGRAIAEQLAADGASVVVNYNRSADEAREVVAAIESKGGRALAVQADVTEVGDIRRLFRETTAKYGRVDIVVNNAGPSPEGQPPKLVAETTEEQFDTLLSGFARGPFFVMQEAARNISDNGRVINISSVAASIFAPFTSAYAGAKAALEAFSAVLAAELVQRGITVNVIAPGAVETKMLRALPKEVQEGFAQRTPLGVGRPRDIAAIVAYLASDQGRWITNEKIRVDGGIR
jgi:3-oxoacyl-[acyl-carrier protein] reductase